jgi:cell division septum initiation protein DivIVA
MRPTARGARHARVGRTGARFAGAAPVEHTPDAPRDPVAAPQFESVLRGYDRDQVEAFVARQAREVTGLRAELADARRQLDAANAHAGAVAADNEQVRAARGAAPDSSDGFGPRAERLLRLAESEAADIRRDAARQAAELGARARSAAETHRHEIEQQLIARAAEVEQHAATRAETLKQREDQLAAHLDTARAEAEQVRAEAQAGADRLRNEALAEAEESRRRTDADAARARDTLTEDITRLHDVRHEAHNSLRRLIDVVTGQLGTPSGG